MNASPLRSRIAFAARIILGGAFLYAGVVKALQPAAFLDDIRSFQILPDPWAACVAMGLPWLEIFAALAILTGWLRPGALLVTAGMLVTFIAAALHAMSRGIDIRCGCFGSEGTTEYAVLLTRNAVLLILTGICLTSPAASPRNTQKPAENS